MSGEDDTLHVREWQIRAELAAARAELVSAFSAWRFDDVDTSDGWLTRVYARLLELDADELAWAIVMLLEPDANRDADRLLELDDTPIRSHRAPTRRDRT
jgi:hypothetical protein